MADDAYSRPPFPPLVALAPYWVENGDGIALRVRYSYFSAWLPAPLRWGPFFCSVATGFLYCLFGWLLLIARLAA
jgi:hypothetical protein